MSEKIKFVFFDKTPDETNIIIDVLYEEQIPYFLKRKILKNYFFNEDDGEEDFVIMKELFDIFVFTDLAHFDFVKSVTDKKIKEIEHLEKCYSKKAYKKNVRQLSKKNITNTNNKDKKK